MRPARFAIMFISPGTRRPADRLAAACAWHHLPITARHFQSHGRMILPDQGVRLAPRLRLAQTANSMWPGMTTPRMRSFSIARWMPADHGEFRSLSHEKLCRLILAFRRNHSAARWSIHRWGWINPMGPIAAGSIARGWTLLRQT